MANQKKIGEKGFSVIGFVVVVAIVGIVLAFIVPKYLDKEMKSSDLKRHDYFQETLGFADGSSLEVLEEVRILKHKGDPTILYLNDNVGPVKVFKLPKPELVSKEEFMKMKHKIEKPVP